MIDNYCALILNVAGLDPDWNQTGLRLAPDERPTYLHLTREGAEKELLRLQLAYPNRGFVLLEMTARAEVIDGPMTARERWAAERGLGGPDKVARLVAMEGRKE